MASTVAAEERMNSSWLIAGSGLVAAVAVVTGCASAGRATDRRPAGRSHQGVPLDHGRVAVDVLTAMYPSVLTPDMRVLISTPELRLDSKVASDAFQLIQFLRAGTEPRPGRKVLEATASWAGSGELRDILTSRPVEEEERLVALREVVDKHRDWTEKRITEEIVAQGGRYDPARKDAFLALVVPRIRAWPPALGTVVGVNAEFDFRREPLGQSVLTWLVRVTVEDGKTSTYDVMFEPFEANFLVLSHQNTRSLDRPAVVGMRRIPGTFDHGTS